MNFTRAIKYPFLNSAKVVSIVLVMTIAFTFCVILIVNAADWSALLGDFHSGARVDADYAWPLPGPSFLYGLLGMLAFVVLSGFWLNGYSIDVLRTVMQGNDTMPKVQMRANLGKGFWVFLSGLSYGIAGLAVFLLLFAAASVLGSIGGLIGVLGFLAVILVVIPVFCLLGWAYLVGLARYAARDNRSALFAIFKNIGIVRDNIGLSARLLVCNALLFIMYSVARGIIETVFGAVAGLDIAASAALAAIIYFAFNLFLHFSSQHLVAQYGLALGLGQSDARDKTKMD